MNLALMFLLYFIASAQHHPTNFIIEVFFLLALIFTPRLHPLRDIIVTFAQSDHIGLEI